MAERDLTGFLAAIGEIPRELDPSRVRQKSRDMTMLFSPVMKREFTGKTAEAVVRPRTKADLSAVAAAAARYRMPLLARGAGTCNFGQGIPLHGGVIVDTTGLDRILWIEGARARVEAGVRLATIDQAAQSKGFELRMHSSTRRVATIGGFIGGGHAGVGSCAYGILRDRGNILAIEVMSVEEMPRLIELRGKEVNLVHHAYGANGLITEIEMPLAPAWPWAEMIVTFDAFMAAVRFAHSVAVADGIIKKLVSIAAWPLPTLMRPLASLVREGHHMVLCMVAEPFLESFKTLVADYRGTCVSVSAEGKGLYQVPLYEFSWGHARLQVNKVDPTINDVIGLFPPDDLLGCIERVYRRFRELGPLQLEAKRFDGTLTFQGSPYFSYVDDEHLRMIVRGLEEEGVQVADSQTFLVGQGGMKPLHGDDFAFKAAMDPFGLLNPGKLESVAERPRSASHGSGWRYKAKTNRTL